MALITWLGGDENGNVAVNEWGRFRFVINQPLEVDDPHIIGKAKANRFYRVDEAGPGALAAPNGFTREGIPRRGRPKPVAIPDPALKPDPDPPADDDEVI